MSQDKQPCMVLVCGPNGAGKSTFTRAARMQVAENILLVDTDQIAKDRQCSPIEAGKISARLVKKCIEDGQSLVRESTLTANFDFQTLKAAKTKGFEISLVYVCLKNADYSVKRVSERYAKGGHSVPEEDIRRRYVKSLENLPEAIKLVDKAQIFDNSDLGYRKVAEFEKGQLVEHHFTPEWFKKPLEALKAIQRQQEPASIPVKHRNSGPER